MDCAICQLNCAESKLRSTFRHVREARERTGHTIIEVAQRSGYSAGYISQVERDLANPSLGTLQRIARALEVPLPSFFVSAMDAPESANDVRDERGASGARVVR